MNEDDTRLLNRFRSVIESILSIDCDQFRTNCEVMFSTPSNSRIIELSIGSWSACLACSRIINSHFDAVSSVSGWRDSVQSISQHYDTLVEYRTRLDTYSWSHGVSLLPSLLHNFKEKLIVPLRKHFYTFEQIIFINLLLEFENRETVDEDALRALDHYIKTGNHIGSYRYYKKLFVSSLENYILNPQSCADELSGNTTRSLADTSFFAIAAPSMEGKTQSAFVFKILKALYFSFGANEQLIYKNFASLSDSLEAFARSDVRDMLNVQSRLNGLISASDIESCFQNVKLRTLGFLVALVKESCDNFKQSNLPWMKYHAQRPDFEFMPLSYSEFLTMSKNKNLFTGFCLFLDEFMDHDWSVFIRNLARKIGLTCVVANTNSRIGNLVGSHRSSGSSNARVWSFVVTRLDPSNKSILQKMTGLSTSVNEIIEQFAGTPDAAAIKAFFANFWRKQLPNLRPGIAIYVAEAFKAFTRPNADEQRSITLQGLLDFVCTEVKNRLCIRKHGIDSNIEAIFGNIGLLIPNAYIQNYHTGSANTLFNSFQFLEYHLYYLQNPQVPGHWIFYTFPPNEGSTDLLIPSSSNFPWTIEYTYFNENELFGILSCMFIPFSRPIATILNDSFRRNTSHSSGIFNAPNSNALSRPANSLEVSAAVSVVESTHHPSSIATSSFSGQTGTAFLNNLIENLIEQSNYIKFERIFSITYPRATFDLKRDFLDKCKIPFLYAINRVDASFKRISAQSSSVFISTYERTANSEQIDGRFDFKFSDRGLFRACIECKNYNSDIKTGLLLQILQKCILNSPKSLLSLVFCQSFLVSRSNSNSAFTEFCSEKKINVYRIDRIGECFSVVPFSPRQVIHANPNLICILLEANRININI
jgi:hypothetical protein